MPIAGRVRGADEPTEHPRSDRTFDEPVDLNAFVAKHTEFLVAPAAIAFALSAAWKYARLEDSGSGSTLAQRRDLSMWGPGALYYVAFSVLFQFAFHGWACTFEKSLSEQKYQPKAEYLHNPVHASTRSTAVLCTNLIYYFVPLRPPSENVAQFASALVGFALAWDLYFFAMHRAFHKNPRLYRWIHKKHHEIRQPMCFAAYYVTYQSHFLTEQCVVFCASLAFVPSDVLLVFLYLSLLDTYAQHSGVETDHLRIPLLPFLSVGHVRAILSLHTLPFGAVSTAHHDWHHEKNYANYALCFTYLDKCFGSYHAGRIPERAAHLS